MQMTLTVQDDKALSVPTPIWSGKGLRGEGTTVGVNAQTGFSEGVMQGCSNAAVVLCYICLHPKLWQTAKRWWLLLDLPLLVIIIPFSNTEQSILNC